MKQLSVLTSVQGKGKSDKDVRNSAERNLKPIKNKLRGVMEDATIVSVPNHVEALIKQATSPSNLVSRPYRNQTDFRPSCIRVGRHGCKRRNITCIMHLMPKT